MKEWETWWLKLSSTSKCPSPGRTQIKGKSLVTFSSRLPSTSRTCIWRTSRSASSNLAIATNGSNLTEINYTTSLWKVRSKLNTCRGPITKHSCPSVDWLRRPKRWVVKVLNKYPSRRLNFRKWRSYCWNRRRLCKEPKSWSSKMSKWKSALKPIQILRLQWLVILRMNRSATHLQGTLSS